MEIRTWLANPFCRPESDPLRDGAKAWQQRPGTQLVGAALVVAPVMALALWMYVIREEAATLAMMLGGPLVGGGILIVWTLLIHRVVCGDRFSALGLRTERWWLEGALGVALAAVLLVLHMVLNPVLAWLFPPQPPPGEILELLGGLSRSPGLLALWLGPVVWMGIAGFEELWRVHLLRRLWRVLPGRAGRWAVIVGCAALVAGVHLYQPPAIMLSIGLLSLLKGWFFLRTGRFWSLVVAHALYDSVQVVTVVMAIRAAGL
jgi:membrane protease YdiL (CAAX protease family)